MTAHPKMPNAFRLAATLLLCGSATLLAGCSQEFASVDDTYVPAFSEERYPISVVDKPYKLTIPARTGKIANDDMNRLLSFARAAQGKGASPVIVSYPSGSRKAAAASQEAVIILRNQGVQPDKIRRATYNGKSDVVALSFTQRVAETKPCGDWSQGLSTHSKNEPSPNFTCANQSNLAAMVSNPDNFIEPSRPGSRDAAGQIPALQTYQSGTWTSSSNSGNALGGAGP
jgi:pilus assembly protein CpaD